ncbi:MAG: molecular chaperone Hsp33 [Alphaproteobacteria bacterium]|nr:molecular chaperone Hsp33 [Alphaproteobacteria bacterium]
MTAPIVSGENSTDDLIQPFVVVAPDVRGRLVRLGAVVDEVLSRHDYPEPVAVMLGEALALAGALAGALKFDGVFTLQTKGDGPISMLVADMTSDGDMRGYAQYDGERLDRLIASHDGPIGDSVPLLLGEGYLAFTVDQGAGSDRYQGIVHLDGAQLGQCAAHYFKQSEQIDAALKVAAGRIDYAGGSSAWRAASLMVQRLPADGKVEIDPDGWNRARVPMSSVSDAELLDPDLPPTDLLFRLFHEDGVRVFKTAPLRAQCRCSRARVENVLRAFDRSELDELDEDGKLVVTCEFCGRMYRFDDDTIAALNE